MALSKNTVNATLGLLLTLVGAVGSVVVFLQPWRSCAEDDSSAGCPVATTDQALLGLALCILVVGVIFLAKSLRTEQIPSHAAGPFGKFD